MLGMTAARIVFVTVTVFGGLLAAFGFGLYSGFHRTPVFSFVDDIKMDVEAVLDGSALAEARGVPLRHLQPARQPGEGVTINRRTDDEGLILLAGLFDGGNALRLIRRDGTVVANWPVRYTTLFPNASTGDLDTDIHGAIINPDGSVVFNFEYNGTVKLSRCGEVLWTLNEKTHHSVAKAAEGGYWIPGRRIRDRTNAQALQPFSQIEKTSSYSEDLIMHVTDDGEIKERISVPKVLYKSGLATLLTASGESFEKDTRWDGEVVHLNKVAELDAEIAASFPNFEAGDLVISLRKYNLIAVIDPDTWQVKWRQTGPWIRQHDPEFTKRGTIAIFNNNAYATWYAQSESDTRFSTNILEVTPRTREVRKVFGEEPGQEMLSVIRGKVDPLSAGGYLITEFEGGRAFEAGPDGNIVWEYVDRYDADSVGELTEARRYPPRYFTVDDWSCP